MSGTKKLHEARNLPIRLRFQNRTLLSVDGTTKDGRFAFSNVKGCRNGNKKPGDVTLAWERLSKKFESKTAPLHINLKRIFTSMKMGTKEDPDEWLTSLEDMREQLADQHRLHYDGG
jgi:hypothetical protein